MATGRVPTTANSPLTAKGDLFGYSTAPARLAVGNNGESLVADSSTSTGLRWQGSMAGGKNAIINGGMDIWQRGTSFTTSTAYSADRWYLNIDGASAGTASQVTTSLPTGFRYGMKLQRTASNTGTGGLGIGQSFETNTSIPFAGQTATFSFWAKAGANFSAGTSQLNYRVGYGTGTDQSMATAYGGWTGYSESGTNFTITTTWTRYSFAVSVPAGTTQISVRTFYTPSGTAGADDSYSITGHQFELGSVATTFTRAGGTIQGELAACQRYYWRQTGESAYSVYAMGANVSTTTCNVFVQFPQIMRTSPSAVEFSTLALQESNIGSVLAVTGLTVDGSTQSTRGICINVGVASGLTQHRTSRVEANNSTSAYIGFSAEL